MDVLGILIPLALLLVVGLGLVLLAFLVARLREGVAFPFGFSTILTAYFYVMSMAGILVTSVGLVLLLNAGFATAAGKEFSYTVPPVYEPPPDIEAGRVESVAQQQARNAAQLENDHRQSLAQGITLGLVGAIVWAIHAAGRRALWRPDASSRFLRRSYIAVMLGIFSVAGIIALAVGLSQTASWLVYLPPPEAVGYRGEYREAPGGTLATGLVFLAFWIYFLARFLRALREE